MMGQNEPRKSNISLNKRLDWIVDAARCRRYGDSLYTSDRRLESDYLLATGGSTHTSGGRTRARYLTSDLVELCDRGVMKRERSSNGFAYRLFTPGENGVPGIRLSW